MSATVTRDFDLVSDFTKPAETEQMLRDKLWSADPNDWTYKLELFTQIARCQGLQRNFGEAHQTLDAVEKELTASLGRVRVRYLLERGRVFNSQGEKAKAEPLFLQAFELAKSLGEDFFAIDAAHMLGIVETPEKGHEWNQRAIEMAEASADERARNWLGSLYNNIGWTYHEQGSYGPALGAFQKALAIREKQGSKEQIRHARYAIARCLRSMDRLEEALKEQQNLHREWQEEGEQDPYVCEELAECLWALNRSEEARPYFAAAYQGLSKDPNLSANEPDRLERLRNLSGAAASAT